MNNNLKIVFLGTPEFAVGSLKILVDNGYNIAGVITAPDKRAGRGLHLHESAVKKYAIDHGLPVLQPEKLKDPEFLREVRKLNADLQIVVAFRMMPEVLWNMPRLGTFNLHASLLPQYRGAAPINRAIMNGEEVTGVTTFFLQHEIDTGNIIEQEKVIINSNETAGELHDRLMKTGAEVVLRTVRKIESGNYQTVPQNKIDVNELKTASKIFKDDCAIKWDQPIDDIYNFIRGLSPYPAAFTELISPDTVLYNLKIFNAGKEPFNEMQQPGMLWSDGKSFIKIAGRNGWININELQLQGKRRMKTNEFLRGFSINGYSVKK